MSLVSIPNNAPSFIALSTDVSASKISGLSYVGSIVYLTDTKKTYEVLPDLTLVERPTISGTVSAILYSSSGCEIESHVDADGENYLGVSAIQAIHVDYNNSGSSNLTSANSYTFSGSPTSTLGIAAIQWSLKTDQNATLYVDQSSDGIHWDISDSYDYKYSFGGAGETVQAVASYYRLRVILAGTTDTTYFRLQGILCPIAEPLPRATDNYGRLLTASSIEDVETGTHAEVDPLGSLKTITPVRLVGTAFSGSTLDPNFWTFSQTGSGSAIQSGELILSTGTSASSTIVVSSVRRGRKVTGIANEFRSVARLSTAAQDNNLRRIGAYDDNDGFFFQINGTTFGVGSRKSGLDTIINSGSFNGNYGSMVTMDTSVKRLVIDYTAVSAKFFVNGILLHTISSNNSFATTNTLTLPIRMENRNGDGNTTNNSLQVRFASILRLGELFTNPQSYYSGTSGSAVLKYSAGTLQRIINVDNAGSLTIYDNTTNAGTQIAVIDTAKALGSLEFGAPFNNGLTIVNAGAKAVIVYE